MLAISEAAIRGEPTYRQAVDARLVPLVALPLLVQEPAAAEEPVPMPSLRESYNPAALPYVAPPTSIEGIICSFDWDCDYWIAVAFCESSLGPSAIGYEGVYVGLYQVWLGHGYGFDWLLDPYNNTLAAWELSKEGTVTSPWPWCQYQ